MKPIASISTTQYILDHYHLQALKKYGQNFLIDVNVVEKIVACGNVDQNTAVIEVGPGIGGFNSNFISILLVMFIVMKLMKDLNRSIMTLLIKKKWILFLKTF